MSYELTGTITEIYETQQVSEKFSKREFICEVPDGAYTNHIKLQLTQDKCSLLDAYAEGQEVKVSFNLSGKPFSKNGTTMYFTNLQAWRIEAATGTAKQPVAAGNDEADNDLPF